MAIQPTRDEWDSSQRELVVPTDWIIQQCSVQGCTVMIRSQAGKQGSTMPVCKWCQSGTAYYRQVGLSPNRPRTGPSLTLDEFGQDLYDAIVLRAVAVMAENGAALMRAKGKDREAQENEQAAKRASHALEKLFDKDTIDPDSVRRILAIQ